MTNCSPPTPTLQFDAFSSGQISSKIWLCEELETVVAALGWQNSILWIMGGWYGLAAFLLQSRGQISLRHIRSFDIDAHCEPIADLINENWVWQDWKFKAFTADCEDLPLHDSGPYGEPPKIIVNSSVEHMHGTKWWEHIPAGRLVVLQSCNMPHEDHHFLCENSEQLAHRFPLQSVLFQGKRHFKYPTWEFTRFMTIGLK